MTAIFTLEFNIFILMLLGFMIRKYGIVNQAAERSLTDLVLYIILPCNIFISFQGQSLKTIAADGMIILLVSSGIQMLALIYGKFCFPKEESAHRRNLAYAMICSNAGFLGTPIAEGTFGSIGLALASIYLIPHRIMMWSEGLTIYSVSSNKKDILKKILTHPCVISCILGLIVMGIDFQLPEFILAPVQVIGRCNTALSMMLVGMILAGVDLKSIVNKTIIRFTIHRLLLMPLVVYLVCSALQLNKNVIGVSTLLAAMPAGATTSMLASKYDQDPQFATKLVTFSTICAVPAVFFWSILLC